MTRASTPRLCECLASALAVHDDAVEAGEEAAPQVLLACGAPRQEVVRGEDGRRVRPEEAQVELGDEPLQVQHVGTLRAQRREPERMLGDLERQAQARTLEEP